jgi:predicted transcriptional regulator
MKTVTITLDNARSEKLQALSDSTSGHTSQVNVAGQTFQVEQRKISASAIAIGLLNAAIDNAHSQLPQ